MNNQVFPTVLSGTLVFILGQIIQKFFLEPIQNYKKIIGEIDNRLKFHANILTNAGFNNEVITEITNSVRELSCKLESSYKQIPLTKTLSYLNIIQSPKEIADAAKELMSLSNAGGRKPDDIEKCNDSIDRVRTLLKIEALV